MSNKKLTKSTTDKKISGVCGGLAEYFEVDPTLVRILFVVFALAGGPSLIVYIALALVLPEGNSVDDWAYYDDKKKKNEYA